MPGLEGYAKYADQLEKLAEHALGGGLEDPGVRARVGSALDGEPSRKLRSLIPLPHRRAAGAFFTSARLREELFRSFQCGQSSMILDPACGAGDLLLSCTRLLPTSPDLESTLVGWGQVLAGNDLSPEFLRVARARLALAAATAGGRAAPGLGKRSALARAFPNVSVANGLSKLRNQCQPALIVLNPPFTRTVAPPDCEWARGTISEAAIFLAAAVSNGAPTSQIVALLPDVLRAGTRYEAWRRLISRYATIDWIEQLGLFDDHTDVDVFGVHLTIRSQPSSQVSATWWRTGMRSSSGQNLGDLFDVSVGPVVPFRHPKRGKKRPYLTSHTTKPWTVQRPREFRRFSGTVFKPPFVVVRRTSRQTDAFRAVATVIEGGRYTAVENHLLILRPKDGSVATCTRLLRVLKTSAANEWLNERIRCRHLTVSAIRDLPLRVSDVDDN